MAQSGLWWIQMSPERLLFDYTGDKWNVHSETVADVRQSNELKCVHWLRGHGGLYPSCWQPGCWILEREDIDAVHYKTRWFVLRIMPNTWISQSIN